ncbi:MAG: LamG domain-containing protein [Acidobacteriota bacterium]
MRSTGRTDQSVVWNLNSLDRVSGFPTEILGAPQVISTGHGRALWFDGKDDAVLIDSNPLAGAVQFTLEVVFRPDSGGEREQRFVHMQEADDKRVLIETRLTGDGRWFLDTFMKSGSSERTLQARDVLHPMDRWYHAALVYDGRQMRHYVDGVQELAGDVAFEPMQSGRTSLGCRLNRVFWFKGAISKIRVTQRALPVGEFLPKIAN